MRLHGMLLLATCYVECGEALFQESHPSRFGEMMTFQNFMQYRSMLHLCRVSEIEVGKLSDAWYSLLQLQEEFNENRAQCLGVTASRTVDETGNPFTPRKGKNSLRRDGATGGLDITNMPGKPAEFSIQFKNTAGSNGIFSAIEWQRGKENMARMPLNDQPKLFPSKTGNCVMRLMRKSKPANGECFVGDGWFGGVYSGFWGVSMGYRVILCVKTNSKGAVFIFDA